MKVTIFLGSESDFSVIEDALALLKDFGVPFGLEVTSAHRSPEQTADYARTARDRGIKVLIVGAGRAAHLAGAVSAHTILPVLGVPLESGPLKGADALLSTVQMPAGVPVGTLAIGGSGAENAAVLAAQILALSDDRLARDLAARKQRMAAEVPGVVKVVPGS